MLRRAGSACPGSPLSQAVRRRGLCLGGCTCRGVAAQHQAVLASQAVHGSSDSTGHTGTTDHIPWHFVVCYKPYWHTFCQLAVPSMYTKSITYPSPQTSLSQHFPHLQDNFYKEYPSPCCHNSSAVSKYPISYRSTGLCLCFAQSNSIETSKPQPLATYRTTFMNSISSA